MFSKGVNERNYLVLLSFWAFNQGFAVDVLWEATEREIMFWVKNISRVETLKK